VLFLNSSVHAAITIQTECWMSRSPIRRFHLKVPAVKRLTNFVTNEKYAAQADVFETKGISIGRPTNGPTEFTWGVHIPGAASRFIFIAGYSDQFRSSR